jgi:hypothetical protein
MTWLGGNKGAEQELKSVKSVIQKWASRLFLKLRKSQIRKFSWLIRNYLQNTEQLCLRTKKSRHLKTIFYFVYIWICKRRSMYLQTCRSFQLAKKLGSANPKSIMYKFANHQKDWVRKSQIRKVPHLRKVCKSKNYFNPKIWGFAVCGTYLRTAHLCSCHIGWKMYMVANCTGFILQCADIHEYSNLNWNSEPILPTIRNKK